MSSSRSLARTVVGCGVLSIMLMAQSACNVKPFCLDCSDSNLGPIIDLAGLTDDIGGDMPTQVIDGGPCIATGAEICDGIDNDCDGQIDNGNVAQVGDVCGSAVGECKQGTYECTAGQLACTGGAVAPIGEDCNGLDDDCDGMIDNGNPGGGVLCGNGTGACVQGMTACVNGAIECDGGTLPQPEQCDGLDNDCNGMIDDGNPGGGEECGAGPGVCVLGTVTCLGGKLSCIGAGPPIDELCNGKDDNCNGQIDEGFNTAIDVNNCGACGNPCTLANATPTCAAGVCQIKRCDPDHWDINGDPTDGCEYACVKTGVELCNGKDDDCNGTADDGLPAGPPICSKLGECTGTLATCDGNAGWVCHYGKTVSTNDAGEIVPETNCDNLDNDCNGKVDDLFPNRLTGCTKGLGACQTTGTQVCNVKGDALICNAATPGNGTPEVCDGIDNDCNGLLDDGAPDAWVAVAVGGGKTIQMYQYEASHPDSQAVPGASTYPLPSATQTTLTGNMTHRSCSTANRLPWINVKYPDAVAACTAAGARLCTEPEWQAACQGPTMSCTWAFDAACSVYVTNTGTLVTPQVEPICNNGDYDVNGLQADGIQNGLFPTGHLTTCDANWTTAGKVYDMTGNVAEWTTARSSGINPYRGGSYTTPKDGSKCTASFALGDDTFLFNDLGFRCCKD